MISRDKSTLYAALAGLSLITFAVIAGGGSHFVDLPGLLIVLGGTLGGTLLTYSLFEFRTALKQLSKALFRNENLRAERVQQIVHLAHLARANGMLSLEQFARRESDPFFRRVIQLVVDGVSEEECRRILNLEMTYAENKDLQAAELYRSMGTLAPAMGLVGTLIGLVQMLQNLGQPELLGPAMATALLTTFYGAIIAYIFCIPSAGKLQRASDERALLQELTVEGVLSIAAGANPRIIEEHIGNSNLTTDSYDDYSTERSRNW